MELDNFFLAEYDFQNVDHRTVALEIENADKEHYLGDLEYHIARINQRREDNRCNHAYIAYYNDYPVGFISIFTEADSYQISYGIRPEKRGEYLGALLLQEFSEKMFEVYPEIDKLTLVIKNPNEYSKKTADLVGYTQDDSIVYENSVGFSQRRMQMKNKYNNWMCF